MVIHFTDGVDGDLADLQRASEELRQEGGFWGVSTNGKQVHCWAGEFANRPCGAVACPAGTSVQHLGPLSPA